MVVAHGVDVGARLVDLAVDHAFAVRQEIARREQLGVEREFEDVGRLDQLRAARARQEIATGIARVAHADMAEAVEHALMGDDTVGERERIASVVERMRHGESFSRCDYRRLSSRPSAESARAGTHLSLHSEG